MDNKQKLAELLSVDDERLDLILSHSEMLGSSERIRNEDDLYRRLCKFIERYKIEKPLQEVELNLGDNDIVIIRTDRLLTDQQREWIKSQWDAIKDKPGNQLMVLQDGMTFSVVHRD
jgi:hypothetical protein